MSMTSCLNLILDEEHAVKLSHLAERTPRIGTIARSWELGEARGLGVGLTCSPSGCPDFTASESRETRD